MMANADQHITKNFYGQEYKDKYAYGICNVRQKEWKLTFFSWKSKKCI